MYRVESRPRHSTLVSIHLPKAVLRVKGKGQWAWLAESIWATLCAGVIAAARRASVYHLTFGVLLVFAIGGVFCLDGLRLRRI